MIATFLVLFQTKEKMIITRTVYRYSAGNIIHDKEVYQQFLIRISGGFEPLLLIDNNDTSIEDMYNKSKPLPIVSYKIW